MTQEMVQIISGVLAVALVAIIIIRRKKKKDTATDDF
ncbi:MAG TPA: LPXTG cell wall anchor domain-containing protein [Bryobacteraceae bacterium]|nr:LPXTG cell wall anchor domain-containing protein [Bryobacteraceae bacterium]